MLLCGLGCASDAPKELPQLIAGCATAFDVPVSPLAVEEDAPKGADGGMLKIEP